MKNISTLAILKIVKYLTIKKLKMNKNNATAKIQKMRNYHTDDEICKKIGISKPTLYVRLKIHNWKVSEIYLIEKIDFL